MYGMSLGKYIHFLIYIAHGLCIVSYFVDKYGVQGFLRTVEARPIPIRMVPYIQ